MKTIEQFFIFLIVTITLVGCGSGGKDAKSTSDATDALGITYSGKGITITGKVIDGYLQDALVCVDANENGRCDNTDPHSRTDSEGGYSISLPKAIEDKQYNLLAFAEPDRTKDTDARNPVEKGYGLSAPWKKSMANITPFTSMVVGLMQAKSLSKSEAEEIVNTDLDIGNKDFVYADYIAMQDKANDENGKRLHDKAKQLVGLFASIRDEFNDVGGQAVESKQAEGAYNYFMGNAKVVDWLLSEIKSALSSAGDSTVDLSTVDVQGYIERNKDDFDRAMGYRDVIAKYKTKVLKNYLEEGIGIREGLCGTWLHKKVSGLSSFKLEDNKLYYSEHDLKDWLKESANSFGDNPMTYVRKDKAFKELDLDNGVAYTFDKKGNLWLGDDKSVVVTVKHKLALENQSLIVQDCDNDYLLEGNFPSDAQALVTVTRYKKDTYTLDKAYNGYQNAASSNNPTRSLNELLILNKYEENKNSSSLNNVGDKFIKEADVAFQFEYNDSESKKSGRVYFYKVSDKDSSYTRDGSTGSWFKEKLLNIVIEIVRVEVPGDIQSKHRAYFFKEVTDDQSDNLTLVRMGAIDRAGTKKSHSVLYNETAKNAIKAANKSSEETSAQ